MKNYSRSRRKHRPKGQGEGRTHSNSDVGARFSGLRCDCSQGIVCGTTHS